MNNDGRQNINIGGLRCWLCNEDNHISKNCRYDDYTMLTQSLDTVIQQNTVVVRLLAMMLVPYMAIVQMT